MTNIKGRIRTISDTFKKRLSRTTGLNHTFKKTSRRVKDILRLLRLTLMLATLLAVIVTIGMTRPNAILRHSENAFCKTINISMHDKRGNVREPNDHNLMEEAIPVPCGCGWAWGCQSYVPCIELFVQVVDLAQNCTLSKQNEEEADRRINLDSSSEQLYPNYAMVDDKSDIGNVTQPGRMYLLRWSDSTLNPDRRCSYLDCVMSTRKNIERLKTFRDNHTVGQVFPCYVNYKYRNHSLIASDSVIVLLRRHFTDSLLISSLTICWGIVFITLVGILYLEWTYNNKRRVDIFVIENELYGIDETNPSSGKNTSEVRAETINRGKAQNGAIPQLRKSRSSSEIPRLVNLDRPRTLEDLQKAISSKLDDEGQTVRGLPPKSPRSSPRSSPRNRPKKIRPTLNNDANIADTNAVTNGTVVTGARPYDRGNKPAEASYAGTGRHSRRQTARHDERRGSLESRERRPSIWEVFEDSLPKIHIQRY